LKGHTVNNLAHKFAVVLVLSGLAGGCGKSPEPAYTQGAFLMNVPAQVKVYGAGEEAGRRIAGAVLAEWKRVSDEFSFNEPYSQTSLVNKKAYGEWVKVDDEFLHLLMLSLDYYRQTGGAFDITFAPLWPVWKEAASTRKMPARDEIASALAGIGSSYIQVDAPGKMVRFNKPVQINMGGLLRGYCFARAYLILKEKAAGYPVELRLGSNMLAYGKKDWEYDIMDPLHESKVFGRLAFEDGVVMSSSGREHFVQIEGKLYSHILDLKTGYPIENFSNLVVYFPRIEENSFMASAALAVMGRDKAFSLLSKMKGASAVWIDGAGRETVFQNDHSGARWEKTKSMFW